MLVLAAVAALAVAVRVAAARLRDTAPGASPARRRLARLVGAAVEGFGGPPRAGGSAGDEPCALVAGAAGTWAYDAAVASALDGLAEALRGPGRRAPARDAVIRRALGLAQWIAAEQARGGRVVVEHERLGERRELIGW